eukprot:TRINITY_DN7105_c0_g1_i3.p1 TRINITY_DN7105_c0_g1~~TRINITY_DN7105_c0_g1_i3.p1  ORF type:complete len:206 (-),score=20.25 TRINITY_DN7105_c0_g1_i3:81-698(-)
MNMLGVLFLLFIAGITLNAVDATPTEVSSRLLMSKKWMRTYECADDYPTMDDHFIVNEFETSPDPVKFDQGQTFKIMFDVDLLKEIDNRTKVDVIIERKGWWSMVLDCYDIDEDHRFGTCRYLLERLLSLMTDEQREQCKKFMPKGQECKLPFKPGKYAGEIEIKVPKLPDMLKKYGAAKYEVEFALADYIEEKWICIAADLTIK